jgi:hypothetical protein
VSPLSVRFGRKIAADIAACCADAVDKEHLADAVIEQGQLIAADPSIGTEYGAPGRFRYIVFSFGRSDGVGMGLTLSYEIIAGVVVLLSCRRLQL